MRLTSRCFILVFPVILATCTPAPAPQVDTSAEDEAALRASGDNFLAAWNAADVAALGSLLADDAIEMPPDGPALRGRDAIMQGMRDYFEQFTATQTAETDEISIHGDIAVLHGTWTVTETPRAGGEAQTRSGKWMDVQRRQADGSWKTWRWMWNQPGPGTGN